MMGIKKDPTGSVCEIQRGERKREGEEDIVGGMSQSISIALKDAVEKLAHFCSGLVPLVLQLQYISPHALILFCILNMLSSYV